MSIAWAWAQLVDVTPWLLRFTVAGTLVTAFAHVLGSTFLRSVALARVGLWRTTVVALLLTPLLSLALPGRWTLPGRVLILSPFALPRSEGAPLPAPSGAEAVTRMSSEAAPSIDVVAPLSKVIAAATAAATSPEASAASTAQLAPLTPAPPAFPATGTVSLDPSVAVAILWLAVTAWFLFQLAAGIIALNFHAGRAKNVTWEVLGLLPAAAKRRVRHVQVLRGGPFRVPVCWGVLRPKILLPFGSGGWTEQRLRAVLLHESAHVERWDGLFLILARVACAMHWLNPLAWGLLRRLSVDAEAACDSAVLRAGVPAHYYARVLVDVASEARRSRRPEAAMALALLRTGTLTWRVTRILDPRSSAPVRRWVTPSAAGTLLLVTFAGATVTLEAEPTPTPDQTLDQPLRHEPAAPARVAGVKVTPEDLTYREPAALRRSELEQPAADPLEPVGPAAVDLRVIEPRSPSTADLLRTLVEMPVQNERASIPGLDLPTVQPPPAAPPVEITTRRAPLVHGKVVELGSDRPLQRASLVLLNERFEVVSSVITDLDGAFSIRAPGPGEFYLHASVFGYRETTTGITLVDQDVVVDFPIQPTPLPVSGLVVERDAALNSNGFYHRMRTSIGRFLGPEQIAAARALTVSDLLLGLPRLSVVPGAGGRRVLMIGSTGQCGPRIYVDGMLVSTDGRELDRTVALSSLEAIEVYQSAVQVPLQWAGSAQGDSACGAIVAWTKK